MATSTATPAGLRQLLLNLAKNDLDLADRAESALREATARYLSASPYVDSNGHRSRPGIAEDRAAVRKVSKRIT